MKKKKNLLDKLYAYDKKNNAYVIEVSLDKYEDIYNEWDATPFRRRDIEEEFVDYLMDSSDDIPFKYNIDIKLYISKNKEDEKKERNAKAALKSYFIYLLDRNKRNLLTSLSKCFKSLFIGILLFALYFVLDSESFGDYISKIVVEGIGILGWVALWEVGDEFLFKLINKFNRRKSLKRLSEAKVEFVYK